MKRLERRRNRKKNVFNLLPALIGVLMALLMIFLILHAFSSEASKDSHNLDGDGSIFIGDAVTIGSVEVTPKSVEVVPSALSMTEVKGMLIKVTVLFRQEGYRENLILQDNFNMETNEVNYLPYLQLPLEDSAFSLFLYEGDVKTGTVYFEVPKANEYTSKSYYLKFVDDGKTMAKWTIYRDDIDFSRFK